MSSSSTTVLSVETLEILKTRGQPATLTGGFRAVSSSSYMPDTSSSSDTPSTVLLPEHMDSVETIRFLEFEPATAQKLYDRYLSLVQEFPEWADVISTVRGHVRHCRGADASSEHDDWEAGLAALGCTTRFKQRLMDPEVKDMRLTRTLKECVLEMVEIRYEFLLSVDGAIKTPAKGVKRRSSRYLMNELVPNPPKPSHKAAKKNVGSTTSSKEETWTSTKSKAIPKAIEDHQMFWHGGPMARLQSVRRPDGTLNLLKISEYPPGDFSGITKGLYLTMQLQVAYSYTKWAAKLGCEDEVEAGILTVAIPNHLLASKYELHSDAWRRWVWNARHGKLPPEDLRVAETFQWLVGPLTLQSQDKVMKMKDSSELVVWRVGNNEAAQQFWTAANSGMLPLLAEHCQDKVWIEMVDFGGKGRDD